ncbi:MAG: peptidoglycan recognition family protein [Tunicatimonas sp.]
MRDCIQFSFGLFWMIAVQATAQPVQIVDKPVVFDEERRQLTLNYMREHYGLTLAEPAIAPTMVVVHWTAYPTFQQSFDAFYPPTLPGSRADIRHASALNVSAHYLVDRDGTVYHLMPDTLMARHVIGLNHCAIGIENVGDGHDHPLTDAQFEANVRLIKRLAEIYPIDYVIGHHEYPQFIGHPRWKEKDPTYLTEKDDPGDAFMTRLRNRLSDLPLKAVPPPPKR